MYLGSNISILVIYCSMMYSQRPLNALLGAPVIPQTLTDFIFPDEVGNAEGSVLDDDALAEIRNIACRSNLQPRHLLLLNNKISDHPQQVFNKYCHQASRSCPP